MTKYKFKGSLTQIKLLLQAIIPKDRNEIYLLIGFLIFYLSYSLIIILKSGIIDEVYALDTIFSFDHAKIYKTGVENFESHTLITVFTKPAILTGNFLTKIFGTYKAKTIFLCVLTGALISFSTIYVYRYLQEIAEIKKLPSFILVLFYGLFSTNLIISFTPESYPISAFLLTFSVYYYSCYIKSNKEIPFVSGLCLSMPLGFVTTTNFIKGIVPFLFSNENKKRIIIKITILSFLFLCILSYQIFSKDIISDLHERINLFTGTTEEQNFFKNAVDLFWGSPVLFPHLSMRSLPTNPILQGITTDYYTHWWQYLFIGILTGLLCFSIIKNYKNKLVLLVASLLFVDIFIHVIFQYGIDDPFIYGGHWVYTIPLLLGWLYKSVPQKKFLLTIFVVMLICLGINNFVKLNEFIVLAIENFPVNLNA